MNEWPSVVEAWTLIEKVLRAKNLGLIVWTEKNKVVCQILDTITRRVHTELEAADAPGLFRQLEEFARAQEV